ncbi:MAG: formate--tetrahydrofolate ligase [Acetobacteraceae bacterium]|nr:formate--tetrahydrofolate ligase [Acetobacteraceae bacterium]
MTTDLDIAHRVALRPIAEIAAIAGIPDEALEPYGRTKAKISASFIASLRDRPDGALVLVSGISPTPAGEGKTTTTVGLADALRLIGKRAMIALREPSLGPCFGVKGGATGGGWAQVGPMEDINLHFTGDFHAITSAHNLLSALIDNHLHHGNALGIDTRKITWKRVMDLNDRALRSIVTGMGSTNGPVREDGFDITVASEVMAVFCLAADLADLQARLGRIVVAQTREGKPVTAADLKADGAMAVLLKTALQPNLVQTLERTPALVHGGPFANIAHGCNSLIATRTAMKLADIVVTEAGFGADLGGEKFLDIKSRMGGLKPGCAVVVGTVRALKMHGNVAKADLGREDTEAVQRGVVNLLRHVENMQSFGLPVVVALNRFTSDTDAEIAVVNAALRGVGVEMALCTHWADGAKGAETLARAVVKRIESGAANFAPIYPDEMKLVDKIRTIATKIYRASDIALSPMAARKLRHYEEAGYGRFPICMAKTQMSFTADPHVMGAPTGHTLPVRDVRLAAGAGFVVALCGDIMTMPGLPKIPAAHAIGLDGNGEIVGLF